MSIPMMEVNFVRKPVIETAFYTQRTLKGNKNWHVKKDIHLRRSNLHAFDAKIQFGGSGSN